MDDEGPRESKPIPLFIWVALGALVALAFMFLLRAANPAGEGMGPSPADRAERVHPLAAA